MICQEADRAQDIWVAHIEEINDEYKQFHFITYN